MSIRMGHASIDENGKISSGTAGDQTGSEVCTRTWYSKPWDFMAIHPDASVREKIAATCEAACANDKIGYDQNQRNTLYTQAKAVNYDLSKITTACECDCSSLMNVCCVAAGVGSYGSNGWTTSTMKSQLAAAGFVIITDSTYLTSSAYCVRGAIYVKASSHTACGLDNGGSYAKTLSKAGISTSGSSASSASSEGNTSLCGTGIGTAVAKGTIYVRDAANTSGKALGTVKSGEAVEVLEVLSSGWMKIVWPGASCGYGYTSNVSGKYYTYTANATTSASSSSGSSATSSKTATDAAKSFDKSLAGTYKVTASDGLNVRNGAGISKTKMVAIPYGTSVKNYGYYTEVSGVKWLYIQFTYGGVQYTGFASSEYLTKS